MSQWVLRWFAGVGLGIGLTGCSSVAPTTSVRALTVRAVGCGPVAKVGTGFAVSFDSVLTVAHTLRGATSIEVDGTAADLVLFDHRIDLAVLRLRQPLDAPPAKFAAPQPGDATLLRRHSNVDRSEQVPVVLTKVSAINIEEPIDRTTYHRQGFVANLGDGAAVSAGDSGSPIVVRSGEVIGMVFATDTDTGQTAFAVSSTELRQALHRNHDHPVPSGPCPD